MSENDGRGGSGQPAEGAGAGDEPRSEAVPADEPGRGSGDEPKDGPPARRGRMERQDAGTTPREPTLAEKRARLQAERRRRDEEREAALKQEASHKKRKRILIGAGVTVGVVALIAVGYAVTGADETTEARCTDEHNVVVDDSNCATPAAGNGGYIAGGGFFPIFIGGGGRQYHYNYGGSGNIGQVANGGTTVAPRTGSVATPSGKSISRGGLGVSGGGSSSGGSSSGGSSSGS
ncbi:MAG: hypothetical protein JWP64_225 [Pseudonocardia sp.]|jgi:hypothetical protein|uniref:hypothetical protein n=1 Tax=Pseudonocardia sp. TaxID=60912 RepID=UPI0028C5C68C|nr:hypothetical protein [Pseudonocardia sp.]MDT7699558.1 hypothetical protein [Pseudonocardiales bacterium]